MAQIKLKLKQASAVLGVPTKELQNLVQLKVIRPPFRDNLYWFDKRRLLEAKMALYLKRALGSSSDLLSLFTGVLSRSLGKEDPTRRRFVSIQSRPPGGGQPLYIRIPVGSLAREIEDQLPLAEAPAVRARGRQRSGWRRQMTRAFEEAAQQIGAEAPLAEAVSAVRARRRPRVLPEVTIVAARASKTA